MGPEPRTIECELMDRAVRGDRDAYGELWRLFSGPVWRTSYLLLHSAHAADDAAQETFTRGLEHVAGFRGEAHPRTWFTTIAINVCRQALRRKSPDAADPRSLETTKRRARGVLTTVLRREKLRALALALGFLGEDPREAFVLHHVEELPFERVAEILGVRVGTARVLAHRARATLREKLGQDERLVLGA